MALDEVQAKAAGHWISRSFAPVAMISSIRHCTLGGDLAQGRAICTYLKHEERNE